jgi:FeS assembly SUF system protein
MSDDYQYPHSVKSLPVVRETVGAEAPDLRRDLQEGLAAAHDTPGMQHQSQSSSIQQKLVEGKVIEAIRMVYDPEIPINIYDLGLIYEINVDTENRVVVKMTLTAPGCPVAGSLPAEVEQRIEAVPEVKSAEVILVWDPPWDKSRMSESAMLELGL